MAGKRETLLMEAIKDNTAIFTAEDILTVAGINEEEVTELLNDVSGKTDEIINSFLKSKNC